MISLPRLTASLSKPAPPSRRLRRLTAALARCLLLGLERPHHIAGAVPRSHQLGIVTEPILHHPIEHLQLLGNLRKKRLQIGARTHMLAPARPRRLERLIEPDH